MNMMRKNNNRNNKHRGGNRGGNRYQNNGGGNRGGANDGQNLQRQKHHATQQLGKYNDMARNAQINGDRVDVEYYLQHVDHYTRVLADIAAIEAERFAHQRESQIIAGGPNDMNANQGGEQGDVSGDANGDAAANAAEGNAEGGAEQQPRPQRQYRQHRDRDRQDRQEQRSDNGAKEANSNTADIPLPGGILPPI